MTEQQQREWLTARQAAERLKVTERHVHRLADDGKIERKSLGPRRMLFRARDVDHLAEELMVDLKPEPVKRDQTALAALETLRRGNEALAELQQQASYQGQTLDQLRTTAEQQRQILERLDQRTATPPATPRMLIAALLFIGLAILVLALVLLIR